MRFDSARVIETVNELGDARFAGRDGEARIAGFTAERLAQLGWHVERRVVLGSVLPRLAVSWLGWWLLAALVTAATAICWPSGARWPARALCGLLLIVSALWVHLGLAHGLRLGWNLPPRKEASVVVAHPRNHHPPSCRVVLLTPLGALSAAPRRSLSGHSSIVSIILACLLLSGGLILVSAVSSEPTAARLNFYSRLLAAGLLGLIWVVAVAQTIKELHLRDPGRPLDPSERTGLGVLLEIARTWPGAPYQPEAPARVPYQPEAPATAPYQREAPAAAPYQPEALARGSYQPEAPARVPAPARTRPASRAQQIELVLAATGGQMLDFAGARAVLGMPSPGGPQIPTIHVLLVAPGVGREIIISSHTCRELAESAAKGLWLPYRLASRSPRKRGLWPEEPPGGEVVALVGSGLLSRDPARAAIDPADLQNVAQLATEIALRWSRQRREESSGCGGSGVAPADL
jgi:hypothetical protein